MTGAERDSVRDALEAAARRLPLAPWMTPEIVVEVVDGVLTRAAVAILTEQPRPAAPKGVADELDKLREQLGVFDNVLVTVSSAARAALRQNSIGTGDRAICRLRMEIDRLGTQAAEAQEQLKRERMTSRPATLKATVGIALVGAIERLTGKPATYTTHPQTNAVSGPAVDFLRAALTALEINASVEVMLKSARNHRSIAQAYEADCKRARAERGAAPPDEAHDRPVKQGSRVRRKRPR